MRGIIGKDLKKIKTGTDNLFIALPGLEKKDFPSIQEMANKIIKKAGLINE